MINNPKIRLIAHYLFRIVYFFARYLYKLLKFFLRPFVRIHPRIHRFALALRDAVKELLRPPILIHESAAPLPILETASEMETTVHEDASLPLPNSVSESVTHESEKISGLPGWLIEEWKEMHEIEPQLFPEKWLIETMPFYHIPTSRIPDHYLELCELYGDNISHVFLIPWITRGGADIVTLNYIKAVVEYNFSQGVTVISTLNADSPWSDKLPKNVRFIEFGKMYSHLSQDEQEHLLTKVLLQMAPKVVHNINSELGYKIFVKYGKVLNSVSRLYAFSFCADMTPEGRSAGYAFSYLPYCFDYLQAVGVDTRYFADRLHRIYAFEREKMYVHYQPVQISFRKEYNDKKADKEYFDIVWAGRLDTQKRPDILARIAEACLNLSFRFHVYGVPILNANIYSDMLKKLKNVTYYGLFEGLASLPVDQYDIFLYTSQWDGLPTILMDAMSLGLPVVASDVGGVGELIIHGKTGFLINPYDDVTQYVNCLKSIYEDKSMLPAIMHNAYELVGSRHCWENFIEHMKKISGYVHTG